MTFLERLEKGIILFDGAIGTQIQTLDLSADDWSGRHGCNEVLNLTIPDRIRKIHEKYLTAGADVVETNTLGGNRIVLTEFDLQDNVIEINKAAASLAKAAAQKYSTPSKPRFVAGSIGPGTKLISLGQTDFDTMYQSYALQARGLIQGGIDLFIIETCQDLLQIKTALIAIQDEMAAAGIKLPRIVSITIETTGTMLIGSDVSAALATLEPFDLEVLGMNCATGPEPMRPFVKQICQTFNGPVAVQPNAGLPQISEGEMHYTLSIDEYVDVLSSFISDYGVRIVGGCCGTTPKFITAMAEQIPKLTPAQRHPAMKASVASLFNAQELRQDPAPFLVGERANTNGSRLFRERLLADDWDGIVDISKKQEMSGAHGLDLCVAYTGRDEIHDMTKAVSRIVTQVNLPIFIDSTNTNVIESALQLIGGRAVINSINLEEGAERAREICRLAKRYGAALIALTIDEKGMAQKVERKVAVARRIFEIAVNQTGLRPQDLIFDALTFTLGSGDESLKAAGKNTLAGIRAIKDALPGVFTVLGVSNVSYGLNPAAREILNSVFLNEAVQAGLDLAIVNAKKIIPLYRIERDDIEICLDLIYDHGKNPLLAFIEYFDKKTETRKTEITEDDKTPLDEKVKQRIIQGNRTGLKQLLEEAMEKYTPLTIINNWLIPAMRVVGEHFGTGKMQLPFVLQSAEVMKFAVIILEPHIDKKDAQSQTSIVLATVRGDVHDIGKNLVDVILSNNGFKVYNLGIKCEIDTILQKVAEVNASAIGMSGLLVKSTAVMKENLEIMKQRNVDIPVLLGGAALNRTFVNQVCTPILNSPVIYCPDAFAGLETMDFIKANNSKYSTPKNRENTEQKNPAVHQKQGKKYEQLRRDINIPTPPFWGTKVVTDIDLEVVYPFLTESVLFRGRWGYRRGNLTQEEYTAIIENQVRPEFEELKQRCKKQKLLNPKIAYGYFQCNSIGEKLIIFEPDSDKETEYLSFPRQKKKPYRSIADFFLPLDSGKRDIIALQVATVGSEAQEEARRLYRENHYKDYLLFHGLSVETAEALAEYWHRQIRIELQIAEADNKNVQNSTVRKYRGSRYSFGYPACPNLSENDKILQLLNAEKIGVTTTESHQMIPEQTTSAFIVHHPQAKYFTL